MPLIVPRLNLGVETLERLEATAESEGTSLSSIIAALVENHFSVGNQELLFRILLAGERGGLVVSGSNEFPADWTSTGGLNPDLCRRIAADYRDWKRNHENTKSE